MFLVSALVGHVTNQSGLTDSVKPYPRRMVELRWIPGDPVVAMEGQERVGLRGLRTRRGRRARWAALAGAAVSGGRGIRWPRAEQRDRGWWPQGIDVQSGLAVVSWHHLVDGADSDVRVSFVELTDARPRFWHVRLVERVEGELRPIAIHAGGLAWAGDRLYVADTFGGVRHFDTRDILSVQRRGRLARMLGLHDHVLPQSGGFAAQPVEGQRALRYSFLSLERDEPGSEHAQPRFVAGEYRNGTDDARLVRVGAGVSEVHEGLSRMQGVCRADGTWYVTTSNGRRRNGDLWVGQPGALVRRAGVLPPGPEDLAHEPGARRLWSVSEHPGARWIFAIAL